MSVEAEGLPCVVCGYRPVSPVDTPCPTCDADGVARLLVYAASRLPLPPSPVVLLLGERTQRLARWVERLPGQLVSGALTEAEPASVDLVIVADDVPVDDRALARVLRYDGLGLCARAESSDGASPLVRTLVRTGDMVGEGRRLALLGIPTAASITLLRPRRSPLHESYPPTWALRRHPGSPDPRAQPPVAGDDQPFFVIGAPRSGTTYLAEVINRHPEVLLTNETRVMTFLNRAVHELGADEWVLLTHRRGFLHHFEVSMARLVRDFYGRLGLRDGMRWGDKHPHYADGRTDPDCLPLIDRVFPGSQFVHIVRDGREVVASIVSKDWVDFDEAVDVWGRHVLHARQFGRLVGSDRYLEISYEELVDSGPATAERIQGFLGLDASPEVRAFLEAQARQRTPFSGPTVEALGAAGHRHLDDDQRGHMEASLRLLLIESGYIEVNDLVGFGAEDAETVSGPA